MKSCFRWAVRLAILCLCVSLSSLASAQNLIHVPADMPSIQAAIFAAQNGDTVVVSPGFYFDSIDFIGKNITVMSSDGASVTTVDSGFRPAAQFFSNENNGAVLKGFTFIHTAGIHVGGASPIIEDNVITGNQSCQVGAILLVNSSAIVRRNTITNNAQFCGSAPSAGGIAVDGFGSVQILNNIISGNQTGPGVSGGGIFTDAVGTTTITGNRIQNNIADIGGGGIYANGTDVIIAGNLITGNSASMGGGIQIVPGSNAVIVNNTVALNQAQQGTQLLLDGMSGTVSLFNNVFYDLTGNGAVSCTVAGFTAFPPAQNNDAVSFAGDPAGAPVPAYTGSCADPTGVNGNLQVAPQFIDAANADFHLSPASPLVDAGNSSAPDLPALDLDGGPRIAAGSNACMAAVDLGAYEFLFNSVGSAILTSSSLQFPSTFIGDPGSTQPLTLTGTQGCAQITSIAVTGDYQQAGNCSALRAGDSCTIQVTFAPKIAGARAGVLAVNLLSPPATLTATLLGTGENAATVFPTDINFGIQPLQTSQFRSVNIFSNGGQPILVNSISITGDFQQFSNCTQFISNSCFITVEFTPTVAGPRSSTLTVNTNLGVFSIPLAGDGAAPLPNLAPATLVFPSQTVGTTSTPQLITLANDGTADLVINSAFGTPDFQVTLATCSGILSPGASCTLSVVFTPTIAAQITGTVEVDTNGGPASITVTGTGTAPIASLSPQTLSFTAQPLNSSSPAQTITVTNISGVLLRLTSLTAPDNFLATSSCPAILDVNASCGIDVVFDPTSPGPYGGFLTLGTTFGPVTAALSVGSHQIFHVPSEAPSIFQAVQLAQDGDTILVAPGTYFEQISFQGKAITIASTSGPEVTILDGQGFQSLVAAFQNEGPGSVLRGFTITHAQNGAVIMFGASPTIENNIITENSGCFGTGIRADSSAPIIRHNIISNNVASNCFTHGGGIWIEGFPVNGGSAAQILNNAITGNQLSFIGDGGGIAVSDGANANIIGNTIQNNSTGGNGGGVAIRGGAVANLVQNLITGNSAGNTGGGVYAFLGSSGDSDQLINNTIADNVAFQGTALFLDGSDGSIVNNLLVDSTGSPAVACSPSGLSGNFSFNDVFGIPGTPVYGPTCGDQTNISGNVRQDPQFVNSAGGNYRLQPSSPAIDAGNNFPGASFGFHMPERDLDGNGRIGPGNAGTCTGIIDLGAYEFALGPNGTPGPLPASWDFGSGLVGFSGTPFVFNVTAQGCVPVASIKTTGDFQQTNTCSGAVSDTRSCTISVSFNPQHLGPATGLLTVDFGPSTPPATVSLTGEGVAIPPSVSPSGLNFGFQLVGTSSPPQQVFLFGNFTGLINVNAIWISGDFSQTNQCAPPFGVFTSGGCVINVVFTPTAAGNGRGTLTVSTNQGVVAIPLTGQIDGGGNISLSPTSLVFPSQRVGTPSGPQTITLSNNTSTSAALQLVNVSGDFTLDSSQCHVSSLLPGQACSFNIAFNPTVLGTRTGTFTVQAGSQTLTASLSGIGLAPQASVSPTALQFGNQVVATASAAQTVTVANSGNAGLNIASISATGDFTQSNNCVIVAPGSNCSINVVFTPTVLGSRSGTLKIVSDDGTFTVPLSGNGMNQAATASPAALNFSSALLNVAGRNQTVILTAGINALQITSISASGDFNVTSNCGASLPTGGACSIQVTFVPTSAGQRTGTLTVNSNEGAITSLLSGSGLARAANTIYVPADQPTIQAAIDSSTSGRTVSVLPGTYVEHIDFHGKAIMVSSTDGPGFTTIDGSLTATVVSFATAEGPSSVLHGFTITRGSSMFGGSGITIASASPVVENNLITGNQGCGGIGINISGGSATIRNNTISNNIQTICSGGNGGGIGVAGGSPQILNNLITGNRLPGGAGGGVSLNGSSTTISGNTIQGNSASNQGGGISIINAGNSTVVQNLITDNSAGGNGGGIYWGVPSGNRGPFVVNNTIANNTASSGSAAFSDGFFANVVVSNNILIGKAGSVAFVCSSLFSGTPPIVIANDAFSSGAPGYGDACAGQIGGNGNISSDPQFVNSAAADYRLQAGSPAIDAGSNQAPNLPANDLSGNPRISFGSANTCSNIVDMGVYEFVLTTAPGFGMSPASIDFGIQPVGTASAAQTLTVSATQGCVVPPSISVSGDFSQTNSCHFVLPTGGSCTIQVIFNPTAGGLRSGVVNVSSGTNTATATVSGQGGVATAVLSPTALDFGNQPVSTNSAQKSVTLTNGGNIPLVISGISVTGDFAQTDSCPASLNPGASCTISVVFTPFTLGSRAGALVVSGNAATASAGLAGVGTARLLSASPGSLTFLAQLVGTTSAAQSVTLTNNGNLPTSILGITVAGDFLQANNCGATLAAGASCVVNVTFKPVARLARAGSLTVQSDASTPTVTVGLSGTGVAPVAALTASLTFAPQVVGTSSTQNATLSNNGDATLNISSILASGDFSPSSACGSSLAAGSSCVITVRFTPTVSGTRTGSVVVTDSDPAAGSQTVALSGTGLDFSISATPASVTVRSGQTANYTATVGALGGAFNGAVSLSCGGLPAGASCTFSPASVTPGSSGASSALSIATSNGQHGTRKTPAGTYTITVQGVSGSLAHSTTVKLVVQ